MSNSNSNSSETESDEDEDDDDDNYDAAAKEIKKRTFSDVQTFPKFSNLKTVEGNRALKRQLTDRSREAHIRALKQEATNLFRTDSITGDPNQFLFDKKSSTDERVKNITDRRELLTKTAAEIKKAGVEIPQASTKVTFNDTVLSSEISRVPGADISVAINQERIDRVDKMDTVEKLSSYLADKLFLIDPSDFSEQNLFDLLNLCNNTDASKYSRAGLPEPGTFRKSYRASDLVCDPDAPFTEANLRLLQKYDLLKFTLDKTVIKIQEKRKSFYGKAMVLTAYINKIRSNIWNAFMSILNLDSSNGGRKTRRSKRRSNKRSKKSKQSKKSKRSRKNSSRKNSSYKLTR